MPDLNIRVRGLRRLERNLLRLSNSVGFRSARNIANVPLRDALRQEVEPVIRANTPEDTGELRRSVETTLGRGPRASEVSSGTFNRNTVARALTGWFWRGTSKWFQALAVEYGTRYQAAQNVLSNALLSRQRAVTLRFARLFGRRLTQVARRNARRR